MTDPRSRVLSLATVSVVVVPEHLVQMLGVPRDEAVELLDGLVDDGLLGRVRVLAGDLPCFQITRAGLGEVGSGLPVPGLDLGRVRREVGATWLWLAASDGVFGKAERVFSRRELVAAGEAAGPDLVVVLAQGWVPIQLELSVPDRPGLTTQLRRYASDPRFVTVLFLVEDRERVGERILEVAAEVGLSDLVQVQRAFLERRAG